MDDSLADRVTELECLFAEQQHTIDELSSALHEQATEQLALQRKLRRLEERLTAALAGEPQEGGAGDLGPWSPSGFDGEEG